MNIYEFVNSRDIREYWEKIGYMPNAIESAFIVRYSQNHGLKEKHAAYWSIIDNTDDCAIPAGLHEVPQDSLHRFLYKREQIELGLISRFYEKEPDTVYTYRFIFEGDDTWCDSHSFFGCFDEMQADAHDDCGCRPVMYEYIKIYLGAEGQKLYLYVNDEEDPIDVDECGILDEKEVEIFKDVFYGMRLSFPTPFAVGDIVTNYGGKYHRPSERGDIFALNSTDNGYCVIDGEIYHESIPNILDFEYADKDEIEGKNRLLISLGNYLAGRVDLALLLASQKVILGEEEAKAKHHLLYYTRNWSELTGVKI